jgi:hypothetical protein
MHGVLVAAIVTLSMSTPGEVDPVVKTTDWGK